MKSIIVKAGAAIALGFITGTSAASANTTGTDMSSDNSTPPRQETTMEKVENGSAHIAHATVRDSKRLAHATVRDSWEIAHTTVRDSKSFASATWDESKRIGRTVVDSPVIAYQVVRGERPLFTHSTPEQSRREQVALTGHTGRAPAEKPSRHDQTPPI